MALPQCFPGRSLVAGSQSAAASGNKPSRENGANHFTLTIRDYGFNANFGDAAHQDDAPLHAVIPWVRKEASEAYRRAVCAARFTS